MKRFSALLLAALLTAAALPAASAEGASAPALSLSCASAVLMEKETGTLLYEQNAHEQLEPASVTKVMTLLLVMEAVDSGRVSLEDTVTVSAYAAGMGAPGPAGSSGPRRQSRCRPGARPEPRRSHCPRRP